MIKPILLLFFLWLSLPFAIGNGILIERVGSDAIEARPGEVVSVVYRLTNLTDVPVQASPSWSLPEGWSAFSDQASITLLPGNPVLKMLSIHISPNAYAGAYPVQFGAKSIYDNPSGELIFNLQIIELRQLLLQPADVPDHVQAGDNIHATFILQSLGNMGKEFRIDTKNCELEGDRTVHLEPGETFLLKIKSKTLATLPSTGRVFLKIYVSLEGSEEIMAYTSSFVKVLPKVQFDEKSGHFLPTSLRISQISRHWQDGNSASGLQGELYTSGSLDEEGVNQFEMKLRGPDRFGLSLLGQYDEYFARFENKKYYAHIGDKAYSLSPLTDFARYGRGVEASVNSDGYEVGGYVQKPRFFPELSQVAAGYMRCHYAENVHFTLNAMHKKYTNGNGDAVLGGVHGTFKTIANTTFEGELSRGLRSGFDWGNAFNLRLDSRPSEKWLFSANYVFADKYYPGFFTNTSFFYAQANYQVTSQLGFSMLLNQDERNASRDTLFAVSPFSKLAQAGVFYKFENGISVNGYLRHNELKDRMPSLKFHFIENAVRLQLTKNWRQVQVTLTNEFGNRENLIQGEENRFSKNFRLFFNSNFQVSNRLSVNALVQYYQSNHFSGQQNHQWIFGGSLNAEPMPFTQLGLSFQTNYQIEEYYRNRNLIDLNFSHKVGKRRNHELSASANVVVLQRTQNDRDVAVQASYTWHFGLRSGGKKITQGVFGQILNKGAESVSGVVLHLNGRVAVTDETGHFYFEDMPAGNYFLMLDPSSIPLHEIPDVPFPLEIVVENGVDVKVNFGLTKSISVSGKIDIQPVGINTKTINTTEQPKIFLLEITNEKETYRRISDKHNLFEFPDLRPGNWKLRILNPDGYNGFYFERSEWDLEIGPGAAEKVQINLLRKMKKIKFQDKLSLTSAGG